MDPSHLATKLAAALNQVVPARFRVREIQGMVMIDAGSYPTATDVADIIDQPGDVLKQVEGVVHAALSTVQDFIAEDLTVPWPDTGSTFLAEPKVRVTPHEIRWWFEDDKGRTVLEVPGVTW